MVTTKTKRRLPHWEQAGTTQYVTIRLADSIPVRALQGWEAERKEWLALRGVVLEEKETLDLAKLNPEHRKEYQQRFGRWFQDQLDQCHGECVLKDAENRRVVEEALGFFDGKRYTLGDFVVMPNHVHALLVPSDGESLGEIVKSWKRHTATEINKRMGRSGNLWQAERFDHIVRSKGQLERIKEYIRENPERGKLREGEFGYRGVEWRFDG